jgi:hypothetical protein
MTRASQRLGARRLRFAPAQRSGAAEFPHTPFRRALAWAFAQSEKENPLKRADHLVVIGSTAQAVSVALNFFAKP